MILIETEIENSFGNLRSFTFDLNRLVSFVWEDADRTIIYLEDGSSRKITMAYDKFRDFIDRLNGVTRDQRRTLTEHALIESTKEQRKQVVPMCASHYDGKDSIKWNEPWEDYVERASKCKDCLALREKKEK